MAREVLRILQSSSLRLPRVCDIFPSVSQYQTLTIRPELQPGDLVIDDFFTLFEAVGALEVCVMSELFHNIDSQAH